jgi:multidrug efflux system membrane fusion protein
LIATAKAAVQPGAQSALAAPKSDAGEDELGPVQPRAAQGRVSFIDNAVDPATATIKLKATFPNGDHNLWPGLFVQLSLQLSTDAHAIVVPATAVQASQQGQYVYVVKPDRTVDMRAVSVDRQQGDDVVIARGLSGGEEIVTDGQLRLSPGVRITTGQNNVGPGRGAP